MAGYYSREQCKALLAFLHLPVAYLKTGILLKGENSLLGGQTGCNHIQISANIELYIWKICMNFWPDMAFSVPLHLPMPAKNPQVDSGLYCHFLDALQSNIGLEGGKFRLLLPKSQGLSLIPDWVYGGCSWSQTTITINKSIAPIWCQYWLSLEWKKASLKPAWKFQNQASVSSSRCVGSTQPCVWSLCLSKRLKNHRPERLVNKARQKCIKIDIK